MLDRRVMFAMLCVLATACGSDSTTPTGGGTNENDLRFLHVAADAPPLAQATTTFWAIRGRETEGTIWYHRRPDRPDSTEFVEFRVPDRALVQRPDGTPIAEGDSLQITITVVDPVRLIVEFQPAGLQFAADRPARLKIDYHEASEDINDDGHVDDNDTALKSQLSIFRQEQPGDPWFMQSSISLEESDEVEADIAGFTRYAIGF
jgi:hypothetical protein